MPKIFCCINIFRARVDKVNEKIYNIKCSLRNFRVFVSLILVLICAVFFLAVDCGAASDTGEAGTSSRPVVRLERLTDEDGFLKIGLSLEGAAFCGLRAALRYDPDGAALSEVIPDELLTEQGGALSFVERDGEITIIVDLCENYDEGEIGILLFEVFGREICLEAQIEEIYFWREDCLAGIKLPEKEKFSVAFQASGANEDVLGPVAMINTDGETAELTLSAVAPSRCFAAGLELCVVELESLETQGFSVSGVLSGSAAEKRSFSHTVALSSVGRYCIIVKPVAYFGSGAVTGREIVIIVDNGSLKN